MVIAAKQIDTSQRLLITLATHGQVNTDGYTVVGAAELDPSSLPSDGRLIVFSAIMNTTTASIFAQLRLFNQTDGYTVTSFTTNSLDSEKQEAILLVPDDLPNSIKLYEVQLKQSLFDTDEAVFCQNASFTITWR